MADDERLLTGDTPTGKLHLGHYFGSVQNRVLMQDTYECFFILANLHALTTLSSDVKFIRDSNIEIAIDYLSCGIDPAKSVIFLQSEVPAISELTFIFSMLVNYQRLLRNPTLKAELSSKNLSDQYPFGFLLYPVGQVADILAFKADVVPVGADQIPHLELTREIARKFNQIYCNVASDTQDEDYPKAGGLFPIPKVLLGKEKRLVGIGGPDKNGNLQKMSKSLDNAIMLSDSPDIIAKKVMSMYTDPNRIRVTDCGSVENNPLWLLHEAINPDLDWVKNAKLKYQHGQISDVECKKKLIDVIVHITDPMRKVRKLYENEKAEVLKILKDGSLKANDFANKTLAEVKKIMKLEIIV